MLWRAIRPDIHAACIKLYHQYAEKVPKPLSFTDFLNTALIKGIYVFLEHLELLDELRAELKDQQLLDRYLQKVNQG